MLRLSLPDRKAILLSGATGLLLTLSFPVYSLSPLAWGALLPLLFVVQSSPPAACFKLGWFAGLVHGLTLLYWIVKEKGEESAPGQSAEAVHRKRKGEKESRSAAQEDRLAVRERETQHTRSSLTVGRAGPRFSGTDPVFGSRGREG